MLVDKANQSIDRRALEEDGGDVVDARLVGCRRLLSQQLVRPSAIGDRARDRRTGLRRVEPVRRDHRDWRQRRGG